MYATRRKFRPISAPNSNRAENHLLRAQSALPVESGDHHRMGEGQRELLSEKRVLSIWLVWVVFWNGTQQVEAREQHMHRFYQSAADGRSRIMTNNFIHQHSIASKKLLHLSARSTAAAIRAYYTGKLVQPVHHQFASICCSAWKFTCFPELVRTETNDNDFSYQFLPLRKFPGAGRSVGIISDLGC